MQDVHRRRHPVRKMMQARAFAVGDGKIMHVALAVQPGRGDAAVRSVFLAVFGQAETEPRIEVDGVLNLGGEHVEVVEPLRVAALVEVIAPQQVRALFHRCIQLDLEAERIGELQRTALERLLGEGVSDAVLGEERRRLVEVAVIADFEAQAIAGCGWRVA